MVIEPLIWVFVQWIHILSIVFWIGGAIFFDFILGPILAEISLEEAKKVNQGIARRFPPMVWGSILIIAVSGVATVFLFTGWDIATYLESRKGPILIIKIALFAVMIALGMWATQLAKDLPKTQSREAAMTLQKRLRLIARANIVLGIVVIFVAVFLRFETILNF